MSIKSIAEMEKSLNLYESSHNVTADLVWDEDNVGGQELSRD